MTVVEQIVNGRPGLVVWLNGTAVTVLAFDFAGDRINHIWNRSAT